MPYDMLGELLGPAICGKMYSIFAKFLCFLVALLLLYYMVPVVFGNIVSAPIVAIF